MSGSRSNVAHVLLPRPGSQQWPEERGAVSIVPPQGQAGARGHGAGAGAAHFRPEGGVGQHLSTAIAPRGGQRAGGRPRSSPGEDDRASVHVCRGSHIVLVLL